MYIVWGRDLFGSVDKIPGVCVVRTLFPHFMLFPIFPYITVLVVFGRTAGDSTLAVPIRRSWKSIGFAWLRAISAVVCVIALAGTLDLLINAGKYRNSPDWVLLPWYAAISAVGLAVFLISYPFSRPNQARKEYLIKLVAKIQEREAVEAEQQAVADEQARAESAKKKPWERRADW